MECTCEHCGSILEVEPTDVRTSDVPQKTWYTCPVCGSGNSLDGKIPESWVPIVYKNEQKDSTDGNK